MHNTLTLTPSLKRAWSSYMGHVGTLASITLIFLVLTILLGSVGDDEGGGLLSLVNTLLSFFASYVFTRLSISAVRGTSVSWGSAFSFHAHEFFWYILASIITFGLYIAGFILLIIPGIFLAVRLAFTNFALIDEDLTPIDAIKRSWELSRGSFWKLFLAGVLVIGLNVAGTMLFGIGVLVSTPLSFLFSAYLYEELRSRSIPQSLA